ncbi:MAG: DUF6526 family protein [Gemmatimonadota bacterium]|nr:DUF6526 family protein [Gemmatimonadota bacterium]
MSEKTQSFKRHTAWSPMYHFVGTPIILLNLVVQVRHAWYAGGRYAWWNVALAIGLVGLAGSARVMALAVQDRLIRLEMRLKLRELLPASMHADIGKLTVRQMVGLRFASDAELPELVKRVLSGELREQKAIKAAIKDWQADWQRA